MWTGDARDTLPIADIECVEIGDETVAADHVSYRGFRVEPSDLDLFRDFDRVIDFDAEIAHGALDLRMSERLGFILRFSYLIENQRLAARRLVLAAARRWCSCRSLSDRLP